MRAQWANAEPRERIEPATSCYAMRGGLPVCHSMWALPELMRVLRGGQWVFARGPGQNRGDAELAQDILGSPLKYAAALIQVHGAVAHVAPGLPMNSVGSFVPLNAQPVQARW